MHPSTEEKLRAMLSDWSLARPRDWTALVNRPMTEKEAEGVRICIARDRPYGREAWQGQQAERLGLLRTLRRERRPKTTKPKN